MEQEEKKPTITIDEKEYDIESMSNEQKGMVHHIVDLNNKLESARFNITQVQVSRDAFVNMLKASFDKVN